jgi:hypothetical protein
MSAVDYTVIVDLSFSGNLPPGNSQLVQTPRGSLPSQFQMDSFGRLAVPAAGGDFSGTVTLNLNRSLAQGAGGNLWLASVRSSQPPGGPYEASFSSPLADGGAGTASAGFDWDGPNLLDRSLEIWVELTSSGGGPGINVAPGSQSSTTLAQEQNHVCSTYDLSNGLVIHQQPTPMLLPTQTIGPRLGWCGWCHNVYVWAEPRLSHSTSH